VASSRGTEALASSRWLPLSAVAEELLELVDEQHELASARQWRLIEVAAERVAPGVEILGHVGIEASPGVYSSLRAGNETDTDFDGGVED
jgi:hypothetical protein